MRGVKLIAGAAVMGLLVAGLACDTGVGGIGGGGLPPGLDTPPKVLITAPTADVLIENGESAALQYFAQSAEQGATLDLYLDVDSTRGNGNEVPVQTGVIVPAGANGISNIVTFNSTNAPNGTYRFYGTISDGINPAFTAVSAGALTIAPIGTRPRPAAPSVAVLEPLPNLALSGQDTVTVQYAYRSIDSAVTITLLLDKDRDPTNDDVNNPGSPQDANSKIIILPSTPRNGNDPTFGNDPPPPDDPNNPPTNADSVQIRTNPRVLSPTAEGAGFVVKNYIFLIDLSKIPPRPDGSPYFIRAHVTDGINPPVNAYAVGSLNITSSAIGTVDLANIGKINSGARIQGFNQGEFLGTRIVPTGDLDSDLNDDFMLVSRYGSPRNRFQSGAAYLVFGRHKIPYPADTNTNGLPDTRDENGNVVDFPAPPTFIFDPQFLGNVSPYDLRVVGRFGGLINVASIGSLAGGAFYRGTVYTMPMPHPWVNTCEIPNVVYTPPPTSLQDADHPGLFTGGLTDVARIDLTGDGIRDFVFGLPFLSNPRDWHDDDPCDLALDADFDPPLQRCYFDGRPNECSTPAPDLAEDTEDAIVNVLPNTNPDPQISPLIADDPNREIRTPFGRIAREIRYLPIGTCSDISDPPIVPVDTSLMVVVDGASDIANNFRQFVDAAVAGMFSDAVDYPRQVVDEEGIIRGSEGTSPNGMRWRGAWRSAPTSLGPPQWFPSIDSYNEWGASLAGIPSVDNDLADDLLVSAPGAFNQTGFVELFIGQDFVGNDGFYADTVRSLPSYVCVGSGDNQTRGFRPIPLSVRISGATPGDRLGGARGSGQLDQDSKPDIVFGAPGADRRAIDAVTHLPSGATLTNNGVFYVLFQPPGGFGPANIPFDPDPSNPPTLQLARFEIRGTHSGDRFGEVQEAVGDINGDTVADIAFASQYFPAQADAGISHPVGAGFVGVIFGRRQITGEIGFRPEECGTSRLPGVRFYGSSANASAGASVSTAGDFDGDGIGDLLIACPGEVRSAADGSIRKGVAYLVFGGPHLENKEFTLSQVGTLALPGVVFFSPYTQGSTDEAAILTVAGLGDTDGDGFDDIALGLPKADFVFPNSPDQRRRDAGEVVVVYGSNLSR